MFRKLVHKARQPEHMVGEDGERLCEFLHIPVPDYGHLLHMSRRLLDPWIDLIIMALHRAMVRDLTVVGNIIAGGVNP